MRPPSSFSAQIVLQPKLPPSNASKGKSHTSDANQAARSWPMVPPLATSHAGCPLLFAGPASSQCLTGRFRALLRQASARPEASLDGSTRSRLEDEACGLHANIVRLRPLFLCRQRTQGRYWPFVRPVFVSSRFAHFLYHDLSIVTDILCP